MSILSPPSATIVASSITDSDSEFSLSGAGVNNVVFNGAPLLVSGTTYRYSFSGRFTPGIVELNFVAGSWQDSAGNTSLGESQDFTAAGPTAALTNGLDKPTVGLSVINGRHYIDVRYKPTSGSALDAASIRRRCEFTLSGAGAKNITGVAAPVLVAGTTDTYRYAITGNFENGAVAVNFVANGFVDTAGYGNLADTSTLTLVSPTAELYARHTKTRLTTTL